MESNNNKNTKTIKFLCSYGRKILPRYTNSTLRYVGGLTRVLAIDRSISFTGLCALPFSDSIFCEFVWFFVNSFGILWIINQIFLFLVVVTELMVKLGEFCGSSVNLRCQLPTGDLETLISITSDEDLANVIEEYDRASSSSMKNRPLKIRAVLSPPKSLKQISPPQTPPESLRNTPSYRFAPRTYSPQAGYSVGARNCHRKSYPYSRQVQEYPRVSNIYTHWLIGSSYTTQDFAELGSTCLTDSALAHRDRDCVQK